MQRCRKYVVWVCVCLLILGPTSPGLPIKSPLLLLWFFPSGTAPGIILSIWNFIYHLTCSPVCVLNLPSAPLQTLFFRYSRLTHCISHCQWPHERIIVPSTAGLTRHISVRNSTYSSSFSSSNPRLHTKLGSFRLLRYTLSVCI